MTAGSATNSSLTCRRCSFQNRPGDNYCERCGEPAIPPPSPPGGGPANLEDGTTRYLCAAAQRDPVFGDSAIAEYLVERVRAIPPSPGVNSTAVLREAVAARARRRLRDAILFVLLAAFVLVNPALLISWLLVALSVRAPSGQGDPAVAGWSASQ